MQVARNLIFASLSILLATSCRKEVEEVTVEVEKQYSWAEVKQLYGSQKTILGMVPGVNAINIQAIGNYAVLSPVPGSTTPPSKFYYSGGTLTWGSVPLPFDIRNRVPMNANFYAYPNGYAEVSSTSVLNIHPTSYLTKPGYLRLLDLDPHALRFQNNLFGSVLPFGVINRNDYLLCSYQTDEYNDNAFHLVLSKLTVPPVDPTISPEPLPAASSRIIRVSTPGWRSDNSPKTLWAIDDYFLLWCNSVGFYKIMQDGTVRKITGPISPQTIFKWQGTVYATQFLGGGGSSILKSTDDGETWQQFDGFNTALGYCTFYPVGDSLVGITHRYINNNVFTLRWKNTTTIRLRDLKTDGLERINLTDLVHLGDTVYLGTDNGLFKRPLSKFFESKPAE